MERLRDFLDGQRWLRQRYSGLVIDISHVQYFVIPKVACSSIMAALVPALRIDFPSNEWAPELFQTHKWDHLFERSRHVLSKRQALALPGRWRFAFVRNPFDRLVSCYSEKIRPDGDDENFVDGVSKVLRPFGIFHSRMTFEEFALAAIAIPDWQADRHWRSQYTFLIDGRARIAMDFIGRFESLADDFQTIKQHFDDKLTLPHLLKSNRSVYRDYYSADLRRKVAERYEKDLQLFQYAF